METEGMEWFPVTVLIGKMGKNRISSVLKVFLCAQETY